MVLLQSKWLSWGGVWWLAELLSLLTPCMWPEKSRLSLEWLDISREVAARDEVLSPSTVQCCPPASTALSNTKWWNTTAIFKASSKAFWVENESFISSHVSWSRKEPEIKNHGALLRVTTGSGNQKTPLYLWTLTLWALYEWGPLTAS